MEKRFFGGSWKRGWLVLFLSCCISSPAAADSSQTLPKGVARVRVRPIYSFFDQRWDQDGKAENVTHDLNNRDLNNEVFPDLKILERVYTLPNGALTLGTSQVESQIQITAFAFAAEVGLFDWLTFGVVLPLVHGKHKLNRLELIPMQECHATRCGLGINPGDTNISTEDSTYLPLDHDKNPDTLPLDPLLTEDVQHILQQDLGYARLDTWEGTGIGDLELGLKAALGGISIWKTAVQAGLRLPTGRVDDPDNLLDLGFGDGQTDIGFYWQNDFQPFLDLRINLTLRFTVQLPDHQVKRVPPSADVPLAKEDEKENVWRNLGDIFEVDLSVEYRISTVLFTFARYCATIKDRDDIRGNLGLTYQALMDETRLRNHRLEFGIRFTTVPWVLEKTFSIPLDASLTYERSVAGRNNAPIANVISFELATYFEVF